MKLYRGVMSLAAAVLIAVVMNGNDAQAQSRRSSIRVASLGELGCQSLTDAVGYQPINEDITIGRQIFRSIAYLHGQKGRFMGGRRGVLPQNSTGVACRLASTNEMPSFNTLMLAFGFADNSQKIDYIQPFGSTALRLSVYKDGNFYGSQTVRPGDMIRWPINVRNARSLSLEAECVRGGKNVAYMGTPEECPVLYFFEDTLK